MSAGAAGGHYTRDEVVWLLGMSRDEALEHDCSSPSFVATFAAEGLGAASAGDDEGLFRIALWWEIHNARRWVLNHGLVSAPAVQVARLRAQGFTEQAAADVVGIDRNASRRYFERVVDAILDRLGGAAPQRCSPPVPTCAKCGQRPAVKSRDVRRRLHGQGLVVVKPARQLSLCAGCIPIAQARELLPRYDRYGTAAA